MPIDCIQEALSWFYPVRFFAKGAIRHSAPPTSVVVIRKFRRVPLFSPWPDTLFNSLEYIVWDRIVIQDLFYEDHRNVQLHGSYMCPATTGNKSAQSVYSRACVAMERHALCLQSWVGVFSFRFEGAQAAVLTAQNIIRPSAVSKQLESDLLLMQEVPAVFT
jgi:hypothetical protein